MGDEEHPAILTVPRVGWRCRSIAKRSLRRPDPCLDSKRENRLPDESNGVSPDPWKGPARAKSDWPRIRRRADSGWNRNPHRKHHHQRYDPSTDFLTLVLLQKSSCASPFKATCRIEPARDDQFLAKRLFPSADQPTEVRWLQSGSSTIRGSPPAKSRMRMRPPLTSNFPNAMGEPSGERSQKEWEG
jgi:hypothetical protein